MPTHYDATMRTTLTLDDDLAVLLRRKARESGRSFRDVVNDALRAGLAGSAAPIQVEVPEPRRLGRPRVDLTQALSLAASMDDQRILGQRP